MQDEATGRHGIGSPCKPPSRVQRVRSAIRDDGAAAAGIGAKSGASTARPRFGARTGRFEVGFGQSQGWRRPKCRLQRAVRPVGRDEGTREAGGLPGGRLLVLFAKKSGSFQSHSPSRAAAAKPLRGQSPRVLHGEAMPLRRGTTFSQGITLVPSPWPSPARGEGI